MGLDSVPDARSYTIVIRGRLSERLGSAFPEMALERRPGETVMRGRADEARMRDLIERLGDLGIDPVCVDVDP
jgi:hypothetical protein